MCGICGVFYRDPERFVSQDALDSMSRTMTPRGPDDHVLEAGLGFGFAVRRLAVIDPSAEARPPYRSAALTVLFNGEIYGHASLREGLVARGIPLRSRTDGELLPHLMAPEREGRELASVEGMYAIACYDAERHALWLLRDPAGEKPLYYAPIPGGFAFASTAAAVRAHPAFDRTLDEVSLLDHVLYGFLPDERTVHVHLRRLPPGGRIVFDRHGAHELPRLERTVVSSEPLDQDLAHAVADRLVADRPVGLFLSGGIDSGLIASYVGRGTMLDGHIEAFTARFAGGEDEAESARRTAATYGIPLTPVDLGPEVFDDLGPLTRFAGEPLGDASVLTLHGLARAARRRVVVALTGDGADEWFHGYDRYRWLATFGRFGRRSHLRVDPVEGGTRWDRWRRGVRNLIAREASYPALLHRFSRERLASLWRDREAIAEQMRRDGERHAAWAEERLLIGAGRAASQWDREHYLPHDPLWKSDLASMAASLELRAPFLDARVRAHAPRDVPRLWRRGKDDLRRLAARRGLPPDRVRDRKRGFRTPLAAFLRARGGALTMLEPHLDVLAGRLHVDSVRRLARAHDEGRESHASRLYHLIALGVFLEQEAQAGASDAGASSRGPTEEA